MMRTSKENIFAHSAEIEIKKQLMGELELLTQDIGGQGKNILELQDNLLESAYCFLLDVREKKEENVREAMQNWIKFVVERRDRHLAKKNV